SVCALLRAVAAAGGGRAVTAVLGNARYPKWGLGEGGAEGLGVTLLDLPGDSPDLKLIERVWKVVQKQWLRAVYHPTYDSFTGAIDQCLADLDTKPKRAMESLLTHNFQIFDSVPMLAA